MTKSIATEKEEIIRKVESSLIKDGWRLPVILTDLSQSLDHIASVARQEGREEAIKDFKNRIVTYTLLNKGADIASTIAVEIDNYLATLTDKEEKV